RPKRAASLFPESQGILPVGLALTTSTISGPVSINSAETAETVAVSALYFHLKWSLEVGFLLISLCDCRNHWSPAAQEARLMQPFLFLLDSRKTIAPWRPVAIFDALLLGSTRSKGR